METEEKPTAAFVLSLIGGILLLLGGLVALAIGAAIYSSFPALGMLIETFTVSLCGVLVVIGAVMLYVNPEKSTTWGVIILVFSIVSLLFRLEGFIVGTILGIIGGTLAIAWKPSPPSPPPTPAVAPATTQPITRVCPQCGRVLSEEVKFCPHCGKALE
ncbi:hypothetical protein DRO69_06685 [Candidatus Bathyarchaeota archaeon]|nr:MAG: hypothetical protein DRO69_06685 [Candidatus Bathyarchaeota archaeon]